MTKKLLFATTVVLVLALALAGADAITGKWTYEQPMMGRGGPGGGGGAPGGGAPGGGAPGGGQAMPPRIVTLDLKADGANLTGTVTMPSFGRGGGGGGAQPPAPTNITNGKVNGDVITFDVTRETQMGSMTSKYKGTVKGAEMQLEITTDRGNGPQTQTVTAKKS